MELIDENVQPNGMVSSISIAHVAPCLMEINVHIQLAFANSFFRWI